MQKLFLLVFVAAVGACASGFAEDHAAPPTRVVVLGTGNPSADPDRWGPAVVVVVNGYGHRVSGKAWDMERGLRVQVRNS